MSADFEEIPDWLKDEERTEDQLEELLSDPFLNDDDLGSIQAVLDEM